ncbi:hypothetical protein [Streptococcus sanguinis]|uniref:hypothetical protein n=1 Tax=Streptococcus sanguinis TaxID=1305 RepID=UPI00020C5441|nr:hypothetical protein [Streptococcus sanguinis]EGJ43082.1 hypothetical protein HMPREF9396_1761 [Streptococcus sanguinis SK1059]EGQ19049.1 hypothetical protein HMPREF8573_1751 [Streptococcus sanguinis ATCC 29667]EGQ23069.1 hypothetical protein HMPREF9387_2300 [Streptococcus sanguinis SK340]
MALEQLIFFKSKKPRQQCFGFDFLVQDMNKDLAIVWASEKMKTSRPCQLFLFGV